MYVGDYIIQLLFMLIHLILIITLRDKPVSSRVGINPGQSLAFNHYINKRGPVIKVEGKLKSELLVAVVVCTAGFEWKWGACLLG